MKNLTDEQWAQINSLLDQGAVAVNGLEKELKSVVASLHEAISSFRRLLGEVDKP